LIDLIIQSGGIKNEVISDSEFSSEVSRYSMTELLALFDKIEDTILKEEAQTKGCLVQAVGRKR
jgi:hypothetical protein